MANLDFSDPVVGQALVEGVKAGGAFSIVLPPHALQGPNNNIAIPLTSAQLTRINNARAKGSKIKLNFNERQVKKMQIGGIIPLIIAAAAAAAPGAVGAAPVILPELKKGWDDMVKFFKGEAITQEKVGGIIPLIVGTLAASAPHLLKKGPEIGDAFVNAYKQIGNWFQGKGSVDMELHRVLSDLHSTSGAGLVNFSGLGLINFSGEGDGKGLVGFDGVAPTGIARPAVKAPKRPVINTMTGEGIKKKAQ